MANQTRSSVLAVKVETTEGAYVDAGAATDFTALREGFTFEAKVETVQSTELANDIGGTQGFTSYESPTGTVAKYAKHSGTEGTAPDYALFLKSAMGTQGAIGTERTLTSSSTAGTSAAAALLKLGSGFGADYAVGRAFLIKDGTNGYSIRNATAISTDDVTLNFNLANAPASGVALGKAVYFAPASTGHPTFTAHRWQAASGAAVHEAIAGCRTTQTQFEFPATDLASVTFNFEGNASFRNPITLTASNKYIDFNIGASELHAILTVQTYKTPVDLAREIASKMTAAAATTISCSYSNSSGKFTISKASGTLQLLWLTGANTANTAATKLGFATADGTGTTTYTSATAQSYDPAYTPTYDSSTPNVVRYNELCIGDFSRNDNRKCGNFTLSVATPRTPVKDLTATTGVSESIILSREVTFTATLILQQHEVADFDALVNNGTVSVMLNHGPKSAGNWVAGKCVNLFMPNTSITSSVIDDQDGYQVVKLEGRSYVTSSLKDLYINYL